jgi:CMP-N-acetylneuraminic acid synthetase
MKYIEYYYDEYFLINPDKKGKLNKTVYISTDEMSIIAEAKNK